MRNRRMSNKEHYIFHAKVTITYMTSTCLAVFVSTFCTVYYHRKLLIVVDNFEQCKIVALYGGILYHHASAIECT
jgi:hypothetical protein